jgi:hypothetical protein
LKNKLFGPKTGVTTTSTTKPVFDKSKVQGTMNKFNQTQGGLSSNTQKVIGGNSNTNNNSNKIDNKDESNNNSNTGDLLGLGSDSTSNNTNTNNNNRVNNQANELIDIFGLGSSTTTQETEVKINKNTIIDDIFSMGNLGATTFPKQENNTNNNNDIFSIFGSQPQVNTNTNTNLNTNTNNNNFNQILFKPFIIDTESFGQMWMDCPNDEFSISVMNSKINSPEKYFDVIREKNMHPIEIINDEAISACYFNNEVLLIHSTITSSELSILYKSGSIDIMRAVKPHLEGIFKK